MWPCLWLPVKDWDRNWRIKIDWTAQLRYVFKLNKHIRALAFALTFKLSTHTRTLCTVTLSRERRRRSHIQFVLSCFISQFCRYFRQSAAFFISFSQVKNALVHWHTVRSLPPIWRCCCSAAVCLFEFRTFIQSFFLRNSANGCKMDSIVKSKLAVNYVRLNLEIRQTRSRTLIRFWCLFEPLTTILLFSSLLLLF